MAPECFESKDKVPYTTRADIFSFGVLLWQLVHPKKTWENLPAFSPDLPPISSDVDPRVKELIENCLKKKPHERPSTKDVLDFFFPENIGRKY